MKRAVLASANPGKLRELAALVEPAGIALVSQGELGIEPVAETGGTFRGTYEVDKITVAGGFQGHIKGGSGTVEFSHASNTVSMYGILLHE